MLRQTIPKLPRHLLKSATHFGSDFQSTQTPFQDNSHKRHSRRITTMAAPDVASLLRSLDKWDQAWAKHDPNELQKLLAPDCTLHADGVLFENDLKGADAILDIHKRYFSTFDFNHEPIACAANPETRSGFAFWQDHNVRRKEGDQGAGTSIAGMWKAVFNQDCSAIQDIYFLRQLHQEEAEHKLKDPKSIAKGGVDSSRYPKAPATMTATESEAPKT
ncbi:hypothetical protein Ndes2437B_g01154 [Nannochloris sp. 'desiccata']